MTSQNSTANTVPAASLVATFLSGWVYFVESEGAPSVTSFWITILGPAFVASSAFISVDLLRVDERRWLPGGPRFSSAPFRGPHVTDNDHSDDSEQVPIKRWAGALARMRDRRPRNRRFVFSAWTVIEDAPPRSWQLWLSAAWRSGCAAIGIWSSRTSPCASNWQPCNKASCFRRNKFWAESFARDRQLRRPTARGHR